MTRSGPPEALVVHPDGQPVRAATVDDAEAVAALVHAAYRGEESHEGWTTEVGLVAGSRTDADTVRALVEAPDSLVLLAEDDEGALACCHLTRHDGHAYLGMFAVRPGHQGQGIGRRVLDAASLWARAWGVPDLRLSVLDQRHELIAWYERRDFVLTGESEPFGATAEIGRPLREGLTLLTMSRPVRLED
ncbi:GNAT family N-acetyltransferase [Actinotalea ferrariae]|nr:GNAT family N-acetyltransferase [Actinotalea ferrariae]